MRLPRRLVARWRKSSPVYRAAMRGAILVALTAIALIVLLVVEIASAGPEPMTSQTKAFVWTALAASLLALGSSFITGRFATYGRLARRKLLSAKYTAEETSKAKTDFLASMSHEIRTPLNSIIGYSELLLEDALSPDHRRSVERIHFAGSALLTVVNDVLDFSKVEAGRLEIEHHPFSLQALINNSVSIIQRFAESKGLALRVSVDAALPDVLSGDEARIRQILLNLLNNALKFTREGEVGLSVQGRTFEQSIVVRFIVSDTGIGIPKDNREKLFRRFSQLDASRTREFGGTGLGLAVSKRLANLMGGEIGFDSEEGKGSTFWFEVPLIPAKQEDLDKAHALPSRENFLSGRLLLVEDLEHNRDLAKKILSDAGHEVDIAINGAEAVAAVQAKTYDLVLMDVQMPVMDGVTATRQIRAMNHPAADVPIIALSANVLPQQVRQYKEAGMNDHIGKPFKPMELLRTLNVWLAKRQEEKPGEEKISVQDEETRAIDEVRETMGNDWVDRALAKLGEEIAELFDKTSASADRREIASRAHRLVSHAGLVGFSDLSGLCRELETACREGGDISGIFNRAGISARLARTRAAEWMSADSA